MTESVFWDIIRRASDQDDPIEFLHSFLCRAAPADIVRFHDILSAKIAAAGTFPVLAAHFVISSFVSDDTFREFRAWLVLQGRMRYERALADSETIADWLDREDVDDIDGESMLLVALNAYLTQGSEDDYYSQISVTSDPEILMDWPDSKGDYRMRFPKLVAKFWNQKRIDELHPD